MLPADRVSFRVVGGRVVPDWLGPEDHPWLRDLVERVAAAVGQPMRELDRRLAQPLAHQAPPRRLRMATHVVRKQVETSRPQLAIQPATARERLFLAASEASREGWCRRTIVADTARALGTDAVTLEGALFADLPGEREVRLAEPLPDPAELALLTNLALAQSLLLRATTVRLLAFGGSRDLVRYVRLRGLLCVARRVDGGVELEISGPFALFRRTTLYGRAYAAVVPRLPWCERFALEARCAVRGDEALLQLGPNDPIYPCPPPRQFDSRLEEGFARDLARRFPDWALVREPEPVEVDGVLIFPDFALHRVVDPSVWWWVEIVGFWTPEYLATKLGRLAQVAGSGWVVCIDQRLNCSTAELPAEVAVVRFQRRLDAEAVIARVSALPGVRRRAAAPAPTEHVPSSPVPLGLRAYFLDWAGRRPPGDPVHVRLAALRPGARVRLVARDGTCFVTDVEGRPLAALSREMRDCWAPRIDRIDEVVVRELSVRRREQSGPAFRDRLRVDRWVVPLVDVTWRPGPGP